MYAKDEQGLTLWQNGWIPAISESRIRMTLKVRDPMPQTRALFNSQALLLRGVWIIGELKELLGTCTYVVVRQMS